MREVEVLQLICDGLVNREIGQKLFLSEETVKSHVRHILAKLQARSRAHAVAVGFRRGIIGWRRNSHKKTPGLSLRLSQCLSITLVLVAITSRVLTHPAPYS